MTCLEAQSNIMAFIDKKLPENSVEEFVRHIKYCPNCCEELEIYYTLIVGMRQVDNNEEMSKDFTKDMKQELEKLDNKVKNAKRFKLSTIGIVLIIIISFGILVYNACLNKVYEIEQRLILEKQGAYFYYDNFDKYLKFSEDDMIEAKNKERNDKINENEKTIYDLIREYIDTHVSQDEKENEGE